MGLLCGVWCCDAKKGGGVSEILKAFIAFCGGGEGGGGVIS